MFNGHIKVITSKVKKTIGLWWKLSNRLSRSSLITIYNSFVRPHSDYGDEIFGKVCENFSTKTSISSVQGINGFKSAMIQKTFHLLRSCQRTLPKVFIDLIPSNNNSYQVRNSQNLIIPLIKLWNNSFFSIPFFYQH